MPRIPDDELERIKRETDLAQLVRARGVELKPHGKDLIGLCPFHDDHQPSLVVTPSRGLWHCLGACSTGGSVIDWVMKTEGVSFRHAVELLRAGVPSLAAASPGGLVKESSVRRLPLPLDPDASDGELLRQVVAYYHETLKASPEALAYLEKRGINDPQAIDRFSLGYANRTLGLRLPLKNRKTGKDLRERLQALGILRESGHEHLVGCVTIPILSPSGDVLGIYGRRISDSVQPGAAPHLYLPGPRRGVWNVQTLAESKELILCESLIDALTFYCASFPNVTTAYGVNGFTTELLEAFKAYGTERVLIAYDRDAAGDAAAGELAAKLAAENILSSRVLFPKGMDANDYARKVQPASHSLGVLLHSAEPMAGTAVRHAAPAHATPPATAISPAIVHPPHPPNGAGAEAASSLAAATVEPPADSEGDAAPPPAPPRPADVAAEVRSDDEVTITLGDRSYRVRGLAKNTTYEQLKVLLRVTSNGLFFLDGVDLVSARARALFIKAAAEELGVKEEIVKKDLGKVLLQLEALQDAMIKRLLEPKDKKPSPMAADELREAMSFLKDPHLLDRILADFERCGVVGEETNKLVGYMAAVSRKLDEPLAVIIQSSSAAGKSALMEAILAFVPEEERVKYSAMTGQSLFYMGDADLKHKILAIAEEEGAERASYALKLLQSEGELTIASTGKDPATGRLITHEYRVEGPVMILLTTTAIEIDEELLNRCIVLTVDEDREQTRAIHRLQRESQTLEGLLRRHDSQQLLTLHRNAQRLLRPLWVANPYARHLTFLDDKTRTRRDHLKYLTLIRTIALLHQYQRPIQRTRHRGEEIEYLEVTLGDIALANRLAHEVLGRSLDELSPQTRRLLLSLDGMVAARCAAQAIDRQDLRFSRRDVREHTGWTDFQVRTHLDKLVALEYVLVHRGGRGQSFVYELLWDGKGADGRPFLVGLIDVGKLGQLAGQQYGPHFEGSQEHSEHKGGEIEHPSSPHRARTEPPSSSATGHEKANGNGHPGGSAPESAGKGRFGTPSRALSYAQPPAALTAGRDRR